MITVEGDTLQVDFERFDQEAYELFLRAKRLPEKRIAYDWEADRYRITAPARFASILDANITAKAATRRRLRGHLFDYQRWITKRALEARRYAVWADTGLGKTAIFLEWARQVSRDGGVLLLAPNRDVLRQTVEQAQEFYGDKLPIEPLGSRKELEAWCGSSGLAIATYHLLAREQLPALKRCQGIVLDESSILKTGGGSIKWNIIHSSRGVPFKLSCTATPAPNDTMEYASQASFLEKLRNEGEILWTYFSRDKYGTWRVKPHARDAFYAFMAGWSIYLRDPAAYGFEPILDSLPDPVYHEQAIEITAEQKAAMHEILVNSGKGLFDTTFGVRERSKLAQIARGFSYEGAGKHRTVKRINSRKPEIAAALASQEVELDRPTIVWTNFDEESAILAEKIDGAETLDGSDSDQARADRIDRFRHGGLDCLITKPQLVGYGLNFQRCRAMVFSGLDDSFERRYQAIRRAYRLGQTEPVHVHLPHIPELEGLMLENVRAKEKAFERDVAQAEANYVAALQAERERSPS